MCDVVRPSSLVPLGCSAIVRRPPGPPRILGRIQHLGWGKATQLLRDAPHEIASVGDFGRCELAGADIGVRQARAGQCQTCQVLVHHQRRDVIIALLRQQPRLHQRTGRDDAAHDARDELLALGRLIADLLGDGDLVAGVDQLGNVAIDRVIRHTRQRHALVRPDGPRGQDDIADRRDDPGVIVERLVEITQAEKQDDVRVLLLDRQVLAAHRSSHRQVAELRSPGSGVRSPKTDGCDGEIIPRNEARGNDSGCGGSENRSRSTPAHWTLGQAAQPASHSRPKDEIAISS